LWGISGHAASAAEAVFDPVFCAAYPIGKGEGGDAMPELQRFVSSA